MKAKSRILRIFTCVLAFGIAPALPAQTPQYLPKTGGTMTGPLYAPALNSVQVVGVGSNATIQDAINSAGTTGAVEIPPNYAGTDTFSNPNRVPIIDERTIAKNPRLYVSVTDFGAKADFQQAADGSMTAGSDVLTTSASEFAASDVGKTVAITGAASSGTSDVLYGTISAYTSPTQVTVSATAANSVSRAVIYWGTNDTAAFNAALDASGPASDYTIYVKVPQGNYLVDGEIFVRGGEVIQGDAQGLSRLYSIDNTNSFPIMNVGTNSSGAGDHVGPDTAVLDLMFLNPYGSQDGLDVTYAGFNVYNCWFDTGGTGLTLESGSTTGIIFGNTFDSPESVGIDSNHNAAITILGNDFYHNVYGMLDITNSTDMTITGNVFTDIHKYGIYTGSGGTSSRLTITGNNFIAGTASGEVDIAFGENNANNVENSAILGNTFYNSHVHSIQLYATGNGNNLIADNIFDATGIDTTPGNLTDSTIFATGGGELTLRGNQFLNSGGYALITGVNTIADGNYCQNTFARSGVPAAPANGCLDFSGSGDNIFVARNNSTPDSTYYAATFTAPAGSTVYSSGNLSTNRNFDVVDVHAAISSSNERMWAISSPTFNHVDFPTGINAHTIDVNGSPLASTNLDDSTSLVRFVGSLTTTAASSDTLNNASVPAGAACGVEAQNSEAAALTGVYVPTVATAGSVVVDHSAAAGGTFSVFCQY
jgi:hypothetical protein